MAEVVGHVRRAVEAGELLVVPFDGGGRDAGLQQDPESVTHGIHNAEIVNDCDKFSAAGKVYAITVGRALPRSASIIAVRVARTRRSRHDVCASVISVRFGKLAE